MLEKEKNHSIQGPILDNLRSTVTFSVLSNIEPERLDAFLRDFVDEELFSRRKVRALCDDGLILVNSHRAKPGQLLEGGEEVCIPAHIEEVRPSGERILKLGKSEASNLQVIYEDSFMLCLSKPRGMHSVLQKSNDPVTVADLVVSHDERCLLAGRDVKDGGLVQRLDFWTSGLMIAAKDKETWEILHDLFINKWVEKSYVALVRKKGMSLPSVVGKARSALLPSTPSSREEIELISETENTALIRIRSQGGSRHVVRKTLAKLGFPLIGDETYGDEKCGDKSELGSFVIEQDSILNSAQGFFLHADSIKFFYPPLSKEVFFSDPIKFELAEGKGNLIMSHSQKTASP